MAMVSGMKRSIFNEWRMEHGVVAMIHNSQTMLKMFQVLHLLVVLRRCVRCVVWIQIAFFVSPPAGVDVIESRAWFSSLFCVDVVTCEVRIGIVVRSRLGL